MARKSWILAACLAILAFGVAACGSDDDGGGSSAATSTASGFLAATALTTGVCSDGSNLSGPWKSRVTPSSLAFSWAPQFIVM